MPNRRSVGKASSTEITAENSPPQRIAIMAGIQVWCSISQPAP